jgi:hypothetical protein
LTRALVVVALAALAPLAGCYSPSIADGQFTCAQGGSCPSDFVCLCGVCRPSSFTTCADGGAPGGDMAASGGGDMAVSLAAPCSNGGVRAAGDPGLPRVAFCPGAWTVPGLTSTAGRATPCARQPMANGKSGSGVMCSAADNCAAGWHVCTGEGDLSGRGFTAALCSAAPAGFWVTLQPADIPMTGGMPAPSCSLSTPHVVVGCGSLGMPLSDCQILQKNIFDAPTTTTTDECSTQTSGAFSCAGAGMSSPEIAVVTKPGLASGGVMCCAD